MLRNSEAYGPNDTPTNAGVPLNKTLVSGPVNTIQNLGSLGKLGQSQHQQLMQQFSGPDYTTFDRHSHNFGLESHNFANHSSSYVSRMSNPTLNPDYSVNAAQNGLLPCFNAQSNTNVNYLSSFPTKMYQKEINDIARDSPFSTQHVPTAFQKQPRATAEVTNDYVHNTNYFNKEKVSLMQNTLDINVDLSDHKNAKIKTENIVENSEHITTSDQAYNSTLLRRQLEASSQISVTKEVSRHDYVPETIATKHTGRKKNIPTKIPYETQIKSDMEVEITVKKEKISWSDTEYANPFIKDINALTKDSILNVLRDADGATKDSVMNVNIVSGGNSVEEAKHAISNDFTHPARYYECPQCPVLLQHPKRFLVHAKWHTFGLTNSQRLAKEEAKVVRKAMRSGEVLDVASADDPDGTFPCKDCEKVFSRRSALKNHRLKAHKATPRDCRLCALSFDDWPSLRAHHAAVHPPGQRHACAHCDKTFKYKHTLTKHAQTHFEKTHACEHCPKKFGTDQLLRQHIQSHERRQQGPALHCSFCGKGFYETHNLRTHEKTHTNNRIFTCEICSSTFRTNGTLKRHVKVSHGNAKPYECATCHRCFATSLIRDRHEQRLHGIQDKFKVVCGKCSKRYRTEKELQQHTCRRGTKVKLEETDS